MKKKVRKKSFSLRQEYYEAFNYIRNSKNFIYSAIIIFFIFVTLGFFFQDIVNSLFSRLFGVNLNDQILNFIQELLRETQGMSQSQLVEFIFINNLKGSFLGLIFGIFLGIMPLFSSITNGYLLGFVAFASVKVKGFFSLWKILPHGIFELPAIFLSLGLGFRLGFFFFNNEKKPFFYNLLNCLRVFLLVIIPLLIAAAFIEGSLIVLGS